MFALADLEKRMMITPPLLTASLSVAGAYSLLRALELRARFEGGDPMWAAWSPTLALTLLVLGWVCWWALKR